MHFLWALPARWSFWSVFFNTALCLWIFTRWHHLWSYALGCMQLSWSVSFLFVLVVWAFSLWLLLLFNLRGKCYKAQALSIFIFLSVWLFLFFFKSNPFLVQGPLHFLLGFLGCPLAQPAGPWSRLCKGSWWWFTQTWPGMELCWKNSALFLSGSSRGKELMSEKQTTGHLLAL